MNHSETAKISPKELEGRTAKVSFKEDSVVLTPTVFGGKDRLSQRMAREKLFQRLTADIPGLKHPKIIRETAEECEVERAQGFNLTSRKEEVQGGGMVDFFEKVRVSLKVRGMITYLKAISAVNEAGHCFVDHKSDSVFINPSDEGGFISIVDTSSLEPQEEEVWQRELEGGLQQVLASFFTRNMSLEEVKFLVPPAVSVVIRDLDQMNSAQEAIEVLEQWQAGEKAISYGDSSTDQVDNQHRLINLAKYNKLPAMVKELEAKDFDTISDYDADLIESLIYTRILLNKGEPQAIDKHRFGL